MSLLADAVATERRTELQADARREQSRRAAERKRGPRDPYAVEGAALAREIRAAMRQVPAARVASESEQDALAQMVAERIYRRRRHGRPADVLRWIDRAERCPVTAERAERVRVERGSVGRRYLVGVVASLCAQSREWLDTTERYRTRAQSQADTGPMVDASADPTSPDLLTAEALSAHDPERAPIPEDSRELCEAVARVVGVTRAEQRRVAVALMADLADVPLSAVAAEQGRTLNALALDRGRGRTILTERYPEPLPLIELVGELAEALDLRAEPNPYRPRLTRAQDAARRAVEALKPIALYRSPGKRESAPRVKVPAERAHHLTGARALVRYLAALERPERTTEQPAERPARQRRFIRAVGGYAVAGTPAQEARALEAASLNVWAAQQRQTARRTEPTLGRSVVRYLALVD